MGTDKTGTEYFLMNFNVKFEKRKFILTYISASPCK
jgi:hypothetical protein